MGGDNDRGVSFTFGHDVVTGFLEKHDLDLVCRAHQVVEDGYEFFAKRQLVTLFSAPNYCGEFDNAGAMMSVDETLMCSFQILKPTERKQKYPAGGVQFANQRPMTPPRTVNNKGKKAARRVAMFPLLVDAEAKSVDIMCEDIHKQAGDVQRLARRAHSCRESAPE